MRRNCVGYVKSTYQDDGETDVAFEEHDGRCSRSKGEISCWSAKGYGKLREGLIDGRQGHRNLRPHAKPATLNQPSAFPNVIQETRRVQIERCTKAAFDEIVANHGEFWDSDLTLQLHHPMFIHEFGDTAYVMKDGATVAAYLLGFFAQTGPVAYVHMVAVRRAYHRRGLARRLYDHFIAVAKERGCTKLKATAAPTNAATIAFHTAMGMEMQGELIEGGVKVVKGYLKPGTDRVVFLLDI